MWAVPASGEEGCGSGTGWFALAPLLVLPIFGVSTSGATSNLGDMTLRIDVALVLLLSAIEIIGNARVKDLVPEFEVVLVRVSRCSYRGRLPCCRTARRSCDERSKA